MRGLISRQAAIDELNERQRKLIYCFGFENDMVKIMDIAKSIIIAMPSAEPKKGKWIENEIGIRHCCYCNAIHNSAYRNFCPNCGAKMENE